MSEKDLRRQTARAANHIGTTNAFGGTEDDMIAGDAKVFWDELYMRHIVYREAGEVERKCTAGER